MQRAYHYWESVSLGRPMELLVFGHSGNPVIVFPTDGGRFFEYEDRAMVAALAAQIDAGRFQLYCVDSIDPESWMNSVVHPRARLKRHGDYERYILDEVIPFVHSQNPNQRLIVHGFGLGAVHAMLIALRHPVNFLRVVACGGDYDIRRFLGSHYDGDVYYHAPLDFVPNLRESALLQQIRELDIILAVGAEDTASAANRSLSEALWAKGIWHAIRWWNGPAIDWHSRQRMAQLYLGGHD